MGQPRENDSYRVREAHTPARLRHGAGRNPESERPRSSSFQSAPGVPGRSSTKSKSSRLSSIKLQLDVLDRSHDETAELAAKVFELSQTLQNTWISADYATKRRILEIVCLNCTLDGASAVFSTRKPFDVLIEGLYSEQSRGDRI
jgi:hypothetical protein